MNHFDMINLLLENGGNLKQKNKIGFSALDELVKKDNSDLLACVYNRKIHSIRNMTDVNSCSIVHLAAA